MDTLDNMDTSAALSYDDTVAYEQQVSADTEQTGLALGTDSSTGGLASRISSAKLYLLSESTRAPKTLTWGVSNLSTYQTDLARMNEKRKRDEEEEEDAMEMEDVDEEDSELRQNALLVSGPPISFLPTSRIFAYATQFDAHPLGLEWIDDTTCILVFEHAQSARSAYNRLRKSLTEEQDIEGCVTAKSIPVTLWPPEERINKTLGTSEGLKGILRIRMARKDDVKKKGAKKASEFYRKHGEMAGKETYGERLGERLSDGGEEEGAYVPDTKRRRSNNRDNDYDEARRKAELDADLDNFLAEDEPRELTPVPPPSPPSRMRSDYIADDGRTLLERTSIIRLHDDKPTNLSERITTAPRPRSRRGGRQPRRELENGGDEHTRSSQRGKRGGNVRQRKTQQELDDELEAFLNQKD